MTLQWKLSTNEEFLVQYRTVQVTALRTKTYISSACEIFNDSKDGEDDM